MNFFGEYNDFDPHSSFKEFGVTILTLMRVITQDSWETVLFIARGHSVYAPVYFVSVMVLVGFVMVNLFMAVVVVRSSVKMWGPWAFSRGKGNGRAKAGSDEAPHTSETMTGVEY